MGLPIRQEDYVSPSTGNIPAPVGRLGKWSQIAQEIRDALNAPSVPAEIHSFKKGRRISLAVRAIIELPREQEYALLEQRKAAFMERFRVGSVPVANETVSEGWKVIPLTVRSAKSPMSVAKDPNDDILAMIDQYNHRKAA